MGRIHPQQGECGHAQGRSVDDRRGERVLRALQAARNFGDRRI